MKNMTCSYIQRWRSKRSLIKCLYAKGPLKCMSPLVHLVMGENKVCRHLVYVNFTNKEVKWVIRMADVCLFYIDLYILDMFSITILASTHYNLRHMIYEILSLTLLALYLPASFPFLSLETLAHQTWVQLLRVCKGQGFKRKGGVGVAETN